jgi:CRP-like cAMP-binding protein
VRGGSDPISLSVAASPLATLPTRDRARLLAAAWQVTLDAGTVVPPVAEEDRHLDLVVSGALMVSARGDDDRAVVVRYCRVGDLVGVSSLFGAPPGEPVETRALVASRLLRLRPSAVLGAASSSMRVAGLMLAEQSRYARALAEALPEAVSASVAQRVAHHLLEMAAAVGPPRPAGGPLRIPVTQQALAQATGTVREVVVRTLRGLRADGVVATDRDGIVVLDAARLAAVGGTQVPDTTPR